QPGPAVLLAQQGQAQPVEGGHGEAAGGLTEQLLQPLAELGRGAPGEGDGQALLGGHAALGDQVRDPAGQRAGLAGAGAGDDQQRPGGQRRGGALLRVEAVEQALRAGRADRGVREEQRVVLVVPVVRGVPVPFTGGRCTGGRLSGGRRTGRRRVRGVGEERVHSGRRRAAPPALARPGRRRAASGGRGGLRGRGAAQPVARAGGRPGRAFLRRPGGGGGRVRGRRSRASAVRRGRTAAGAGRGGAALPRALRRAGPRGLRRFRGVREVEEGGRLGGEIGRAHV